MDYQSFGRPQRPKGANIKQALKVILVLVVCAWLVYQIKHSMNKPQNYGSQTKHVVGYGAVSLGRKGNPSRLDERALPDSQSVDSAVEATESSSGRDDVFDGAREDKAEEEFGHINGKFGTNVGKKVEHEPESQPKVSYKNKHKDSSKEESGKVFVEPRRESEHKEVIEKYPTTPEVNDSQSNDKEIEEQLREPPNAAQIRKNAKSDFSAKENDEDKDHRIWQKETRMQESVVESATNAGVTEAIDEVLSFDDENGVPPDGNEIKMVVQEENISNFSKGIRLGKSNIYEVTSGEDNGVDVYLEGSKNYATADEEFNPGTFTHVDTSGINSNPEIGGGDS